MHAEGVKERQVGKGNAKRSMTKCRKELSAAMMASKLK